MVEESVVGGWVVAGGDWVSDWVGVGGDGFAAVSDGECLIGGGDGGGDEGSGWDGGGHGPGGVGDVDGVVVVDVTEVGDSAWCEAEGESSFLVAVVGEVDVGGPAKLIGVSGNVFGWVAGSVHGGVEDGPVMVEPPAGLLGSGSEFVEGAEVTGSDGTGLPEFVDGLDVVSPSEFSGRRDNDFGPEEQAETSPFSPWVVLMSGVGKGVISPKSLGNR